MSLKQLVSNTLHGLRVAFVAVTVFQFSLGGPLAGSLQAQQMPPTATPIKHLIVLIGENRTFDHIFATYVPKSERFRLEPFIQGNHQRGRHTGLAFLQSRAIPGGCPLQDQVLHQPGQH